MILKVKNEEQKKIAEKLINNTTIYGECSREEQEVFKLADRQGVASEYHIEFGKVTGMIGGFAYYIAYCLPDNIEIVVPKKKLKIEFTEVDLICGNLLLYRVLDQLGLPSVKSDGYIKIESLPEISFDEKTLWLRGDDEMFNQKYVDVKFDVRSKSRALINHFEKAINDELFPEIEHQIEWGKKCLVKNEDSRTWQERVYVGEHPYKRNKDGNRCVITSIKDYTAVYDYCKPLPEYTVKHTREEIDNKIILTWEQD